MRRLEVDYDRFEREGFLHLPGCVESPRLELLRRRAEQIMLGEISYAGMFFQLDGTTGRYEDLEVGKGWQGPSLNYRKIEKLELDPLYREWIEDPLLEPIVRRQVGASIRLYRAILMSKSAHGGTLLPWHQDGGKMWGLTRDPVLQIWTALDDAPPDAGGLELIPGSHAWGLATPLGGMVPPEIVMRHDAEGRAVSIDARAGDLVLLHNYLWHRSGTNRTAATRRALSACYIDADTRCTRTRRAPRRFVPLFEPGAAR